MRGSAVLLALVLAAVRPSLAAEFSDKQLAQQQRMIDCVAEAKAQGLRGPPRLAFLKTCLSGGEVTVELQDHLGAQSAPDAPEVPADR